MDTLGVIHTFDTNDLPAAMQALLAGEMVTIIGEEPNQVENFPKSPAEDESET
ncbi:MAG TPA: hypothetical protein PLZ55_13470 [bacterium]|nr:hypothetical protein [bacterium]